MLESYRQRFLSSVEAKVALAVEDAARYSAALPGSPSDLHVVQLGPGRWLIGSNRRYAKAQERGAYIVPKRGRALHFRDGRWRPRARLKAKHYLAKTGHRWSLFVRTRLR